MTPNDTPASGDPTERQLLAQLGLGPGASNAEIEAAHDEVLAFLERAPGSLRQWARQRMSEVDEAYAILGSEGSNDASPAIAGPASRPAQPTGRAHRQAQAVSHDQGRDELDEIDPDREPPRRARRDGQATGSVRPNRLSSLSVAGVGPGRSVRRTLLAGAAVVALIVGAVGIYQLGSPAVPPITGSPNPSTAGVDPAQVTALMQKLVATPNDVTTLQQLADLYYAASDYATAKTWLGQILAIDPKNVAALLGAGAVGYNTNDLVTAETDWRAVLAVDSKNVEAHYDLGFMYLSENNLDQVKVEWNQVIALAPDSDIAKTVATHLATLDGSPAPSGAGSSPAASPAASPAPSDAPSPAPSAPPVPSPS